jgi:hypothetical protein
VLERTHKVVIGTIVVAKAVELSAQLPFLAHNKPKSYRDSAPKRNYSE